MLWININIICLIVNLRLIKPKTNRRALLPEVSWHPYHCSPNVSRHVELLELLRINGRGCISVLVVMLCSHAIHRFDRTIKSNLSNKHYFIQQKEFLLGLKWKQVFVYEWKFNKNCSLYLKIFIRKIGTDWSWSKKFSSTQCCEEPSIVPCEMF